jgi:hypothetical protein
MGGKNQFTFDRNGKIKKYWLKSLNRNSWHILRAIDVPKKSPPSSYKVNEFTLRSNVC